MRLTKHTPLSAPWFTMPEAVDYTREVAAEQTIGIHDALLSDLGRKFVGGNFIGPRGGKDYRPLAPGESVEIS
jgi:hypothetical protein